MKKSTIAKLRAGYVMAVVGLLAWGLFPCAAQAQNTAGALAVKNGDKIAFLGDSITAFGAKKDGYINLVVAGLKSDGMDVTSVPAGKAGHKSCDMLARLDADVISKSPQWMLVSCGVNDAWHFKLHMGARTFQGVSVEDYKKNMTAIIDQAQAAKIKVMILTATMIGENPERDLNKDLVPYNEVLRKLAQEKNCLLADLDKDMHAALLKIPDVKGPARMFGEPEYKRDIKNKLTVDGCHMNAQGNIMMAKGVLRAFGLSEEKMAAAEKAWLAKK